MKLDALLRADKEQHENLIALGPGLMLPPRKKPRRPDIEAARVPIGCRG